jgi:preprotein translocase subunit SecY
VRQTKGEFLLWLIAILNLYFVLHIINGVFVSPGAAEDVVKSLRVDEEKQTKGSSFSC